MKRKQGRKLRPSEADPSVATENTRPASLDELMLRLWRRLGDAEGAWRCCEIKPCRRFHRCMDPAVACFSKRPRRPTTPEETAQAVHELRVMLDKSLRERGVR